MHERRTHPRRERLTEAEAERVADVFTAHQSFVAKVAQLHAPGPDHVPDIVQAVGIKLCQSLNGFRGDAELKTWLYRVTVNTARDHYQRERRQARAVEAITAYPEPDQVIDPDEMLEGRERVDALHAAVEQLKPLYQDVIRNDLRGSAVLRNRKTSRHRARTQLRQLLAEDPRLDPPDEQ